MTRALEAIALEAWPPRERVDFDGWVLGESGGFTRRSNSVLPLAAGRLPLGDKINYCEAFYAERGARTVFKMTEASEPPVLDAVLDERGYRRADPTSVQTTALEDGWFERDAEVEIRRPFRMSWLRDCAAVRGLAVRDADALREILVRIATHPGPCGFASLVNGGITYAVALGVVRDGHLVIFDVGTRSDVRRRGLGRRVTESVLAWGAEQGARTALLQVEVANEGAIALYQKLGFEEQYRYWYREGELGKRS